MESKIKIKLGPIEVEYEGSETFLKRELLDLIKTVIELSKSAKVPIQENVDDEFPKRTGKIQLSTNAIAIKLSCSGGPDLVTAAAAHLALVKGIETFSRKQLIAEMRTAAGYFRQSYRDNLTSLLKGLSKNDVLNEPSTGHFSLTGKKRKELETKLAK